MIEISKRGPFCSYLTYEHISRHFSINHTWRDLFELHHTTFDIRDYVYLAWKIFESNGFTFDIIRYSNNPNSSVYSAVKSINLYNKNGEWVAGYFDVSYSHCMEQLLINVITTYRMDFREFSRNTTHLAVLTSSNKYGI